MTFLVTENDIFRTKPIIQDHKCFFTQKMICKSSTMTSVDLQDDIVRSTKSPLQTCKVVSWDTKKDELNSPTKMTYLVAESLTTYKS